MKKKFFTRDIRIKGVLKRSPRFKTKREADEWYESKKHERDSVYRTYVSKIDQKTTLREYFESLWFVKRVKDYPRATTDSDKQRFNTYIKPSLGHLIVSKINAQQIRKCIGDVVDVHEKSPVTRDRVRALLSKIFTDAMNETTALRESNPASNITFEGRRVGKYKPKFISKKDEIKAYLKAAKELGPNHLVFASLGIMAGLRKSEIIALKWGDIDFADSMISVRRKFEQASMTILEGTKSGSKVFREVPAPDQLIAILKKHMDKSDFQGDGDFVLTKDDGEVIPPRNINRMLTQVQKLSGVAATPHALRHTYGREFVIGSGNMKALQTILGHSSMAVTEIYSELAGKHVSKLRNTVSFDVDGDDE